MMTEKGEEEKTLISLLPPTSLAVTRRSNNFAVKQGKGEGAAVGVNPFTARAREMVAGTRRGKINCKLLPQHGRRKGGGGEASSGEGENHEESFCFAAGSTREEGRERGLLFSPSSPSTLHSLSLLPSSLLASDSPYRLLVLVPLWPSLLLPPPSAPLLTLLSLLFPLRPFLHLLLHSSKQCLLAPLAEERERETERERTFHLS